jgi:hypothetical protein
MSSTDHTADFFQDLDLRLLNDKERQELLDFYHSLLKRNKSKTKHSKESKDKKTKRSSQSKLYSFPVKPFEPIKREQIYAR